MGLLDSIKNFVYAGNGRLAESEDDYYEEYDEIPEQYTERVDELSAARERKRAVTKISEFSQTSTAPVQSFVKITRPVVVDDSTSICNYLKNSNICVVILEGVENAEAQRIADFLGGATYALGGNIRRLSPSIFIIAPSNVSFSEEDLKEQLKSSGLVFPNVAGLFK